MSEATTILKVFLASPSDLQDEKDAVEEVINELNELVGPLKNLRLKVVRWEKDSVPSIGSDAQQVINDQISSDYDIFVGMLWTRFGSPTPRAGSGTVEEFQRAYKRYEQNDCALRVLFYFKDEPPYRCKT